MFEKCGDSSKGGRVFLEALERLVSNQPINPEILKKLDAGKSLKITPTLVALEAGRSRDTLYKYYPEIMGQIRGLSSEARKTRPREVKSKAALALDEIRKEKQLLIEEKRNLATHNMALFVQVEQLQEKLSTAEQRILFYEKRIQDNKLSSSNWR